MFYLIRCVYIGPNLDQTGFTDHDTIEIHTSPATHVSTKEAVLEGGCGTWHDYSFHAHGAFATLEQAQRAIAEVFGAVRDCDPNGEPFEADSEVVIQVFKPGKYSPMSVEEIVGGFYANMESDIEASTSDERIAELVQEYEAEANSYGYSSDGRLADILRRWRDGLSSEPLS